MLVKKIQPFYFPPSNERHQLAETTAKAPRDPYTQPQRKCSNISRFLKCSEARQASPENLRACCDKRQRLPAIEFCHKELHPRSRGIPGHAFNVIEKKYKSDTQIQWLDYSDFCFYHFALLLGHLDQNQRRHLIICCYIIF